MWKTFSMGKPSPRNEFVYNIDDFEPSPGAAIRVGDYKLITGNPDILYPIRTTNQSDGWFNYGDPLTNGFPGPPTSIPAENVTYLFNIRDDPEERNNIADLYPEIVQALRTRLDEYREGLVPPIDDTPDLAGLPSNFDGVWSPGWRNVSKFGILSK
ncbi:arylsulfatase B-like [Saccoglossus kowalevskii]|uniref:Arylsulfatase B-like n=1 Tax=Saccoglossus kowalevskii TaxID=10224 RepID=A0ABM0MB15_SACKO|nr:PREDICTED: arylsulfatase B-like [Saccoglossus kowalevskii]